MKTTLLQAVRAVEHADSNPSRVALFERVRRRSPAIRLVVWIYDRLPRALSSLLAAAYGTYERARFRDAQHRPILALAVHPTYRPALAHVALCVGTDHVAQIEARRPGPGALLRTLVDAFSERRRPSALRIVRRVHRRHGFLVTTRVSAAIGWYLAGRSVLGRSDARVVLVSSDYNPESVGLARAAQALGRKAVFVAHTHPHDLCPALDFDLTILDGEAALREYQRKGPVRGEVVYRGVDGTASPLRIHQLSKGLPVIGLFLPKEVAWPVLEDIVHAVRTQFPPARLLIRRHPNMLEHPRLARELTNADDIEWAEPGESLADSSRRCDFVLADQASNVHLGVLRSGTPCIPVAGLSAVESADRLGLIRSGVLPPPWSGGTASRAAWAEHFAAADWAERFCQYDASYLRDSALLEQKIGERIREFAGLD